MEHDGNVRERQGEMWNKRVTETQNQNQSQRETDCQSQQETECQSQIQNLNFVFLLAILLLRHHLMYSQQQVVWQHFEHDEQHSEHAEQHSEYKQAEQHSEYS